jgi:hypothetical protein
VAIPDSSHQCCDSVLQREKKRERGGWCEGEEKQQQKKMRKKKTIGEGGIRREGWRKKKGKTG